MKIALIHMRHAHTGGTERYLSQLARHLGEQGHEPVVVCRSHEEPPHPAARFHVLRDFAIGGSWRMWAFARAVERHVAESDYDLVLGLGKTWTHDVVRLGGGLHGTYLELAHGDTLSRAERLVGKGRIKHRLALSIERRALRAGAFQKVITNAAMVKRDAIARYGIPAAAIEVVHNGVDLERFHPRLRKGVGAELRRSLGLEPSHLVVLFLGTGYGRKGLDLLQDAFAAFAGRRPEARLLIVGYDSARRAFEARGARLGIAEVSRYLGGRRDPEACFAAADLYVLPTRYDPFANSTLEALAAGLPVITSDTNGACELIEPGVEGEVIPHGAGARALLEGIERWSDPERLREGSRAARALAERHGIESKLQATTRLLLEVAGQGAPH
ncbi:MAG: glycosyltransferase family 4 protein [Planctomycetota bacterium]|nr:glycosyltransferase family 4 protein [Planctomycetota bacterium]